MPPVEHLHQGPAGVLLEQELHLRVERRSVQAGLRRGHQGPSRAIDHLEHVPVAVDPIL
jgi:hypothetical protein